MKRTRGRRFRTRGTSESGPVAWVRYAIVPAGAVLLGALLLGAASAKRDTLRVYSVERKEYVVMERVRKSDADWKKQLTPEQYRITRQAGTERAFTGAYWNHHGLGVYRCVACDNDLFSSETKFESGTGWPSFWEPVARENVALRDDRGSFMVRTEVLCARCDAHLGHLFDDGPKPTGLRYCVNSEALAFQGEDPAERPRRGSSGGPTPSRR